MDLDLALLRNGLIFFILIASSLCLRAFAQAWVATRLGDRTPEDEGRLTANPLPHIDLLGTVALPLIFIFYVQPALSRQGLMLFLGWAKPVPMNPGNFHDPRRGAVLAQFAGAGMSVLLLLFAAVGGGVLYRADPQVVGLFLALISINSSLLVWDLLPIPPLPGGALLRYFGHISEETYYNIARWSGLVLILLINLRPFTLFFGFVQQLIALPFGLLMQAIAG